MIKLMENYQEVSETILREQEIDRIAIIEAVMKVKQ